MRKTHVVAPNDQPWRIAELGRNHPFARGAFGVAVEDVDEIQADVIAVKFAQDGFGVWAFDVPQGQLQGGLVFPGIAARYFVWANPRPVRLCSGNQVRAEFARCTHLPFAIAKRNLVDYRIRIQGQQADLVFKGDVDAFEAFVFGVDPKGLVGKAGLQHRRRIFGRQG